MNQYSPYEANYRQTRLQVEGPGYPTVIMTVGTPRHLPSLIDRAVELGTSQRIRTRLVSVMECAASAIQLSSLMVQEMLTEELQCDVFIDNTVITDEISSYHSEENVRAHVLHMLRTNMCMFAGISRCWRRENGHLPALHAGRCACTHPAAAC